MSAEKAARNLDRILDEKRITYTQFAGMLESAGFHITPKQVVRSIGAYRASAMTRRYVTPDMITAASRALDVPESMITGDQ